MNCMNCMNSLNFGIPPIDFEIDCLRQQFSNIKATLGSGCVPGQPIVYQNSYSQSNQCRSRSWVPPKCDDPLVNLVLDIKYEMRDKDCEENNCGFACAEESVCIEFANDQFITINASNDATNSNGIVLINGHPSCKRKRIIYDFGLLLRAIDLRSTRENINHLLDFLEDLAANCMYFKMPVCAIICELKTFVATI